MNKKEIKNQTNLDNIPVFVYDDKPEEIPSLEKFRLSLNNKPKEEQNKNNNIDNNNKIENTPHISKEQLIKELSDNLGIDMPSNDTNTNNSEAIKNSLTTIQEVTNESISPSYISVNEKKQEKKEEIIEDSIIPNTFEDQNDLMSFYGVNNDIENIVNNLQFNDNMRQDFSIIVDDYLEVVQFNKINQEQIKKIILSINQKDLSDCKRVMESLDYDGKIISKISDINFLLIKAKDIDNKDMEEIKKKNEEQENCLYAWRDILPGEDSFFRAIMFSFLEEIILSRNINNYLIFLYELSKNIENNFFKNILSYYNIDYLKPKYCLILIYYALTIQDIQTSIDKAHSLLIKIYNYDVNFDLLLILNLKFLIYKYLKNNEKKLYTREYSVQIGNLLPSQYKILKGNYNFKEYYSNCLLQLNKEPERITMSVIPFILRRDLFIYSFDQKKMNHIWIHADTKNKEFIPFRLVILNGSYYIIYQKEYYNQFNKIFSKFSNISNNKSEKKNINDDNLIQEKFLDIDDEEKDENKKKIDEFKKSQNNNMENIINNINNIKISNNNIDNKMIGQDNKKSINHNEKSPNSNYNNCKINNNFNNYEKNNNMNYFPQNNVNNYYQPNKNNITTFNQNTINNNLNLNTNNNINSNQNTINNNLNMNINNDINSNQNTVNNNLNMNINNNINSNQNTINNILNMNINNNINSNQNSINNNLNMNINNNINTNISGEAAFNNFMGNDNNAINQNNNNINIFNNTNYKTYSNFNNNNNVINLKSNRINNSKNKNNNINNEPQNITTSNYQNIEKKDA